MEVREQMKKNIYIFVAMFIYYMKVMDVLQHKSCKCPKYRQGLNLSPIAKIVTIAKIGRMHL